MDIRRGVFRVEHFKNTTSAWLLLERVRSPEGSAGEFHVGRRVFWESALRHLHSHYPYPFPCHFKSLSLSLSLSLCSFSFSCTLSLCHYSASVDSSGEERRQRWIPVSERSGVGFLRLYSCRELYGISRDSNVLCYKRLFRVGFPRKLHLCMMWTLWSTRTTLYAPRTSG